MELALAEAEEPPSVVPVQKLITGPGPEEWDGDIWGDLNENNSREPEEGASGEVEEVEEKDVRPLTRTDIRTPMAATPALPFARPPGQDPSLVNSQPGFRASRAKPKRSTCGQFL